MRNLVVVLVVLSCTCICHAGLSDGLVGYYNFDNNLDDLSLSANVNDAAAVGSPDFSIAGLFGGGVKVGDGSGTSYVSLGMPSDYLFGDSTSFTFTYWVKMPGSQASDPGLIGNKDWSSSGGAQGFVQAMVSGDNVKANVADGSTRADTSSTDLDHDSYWDGQGKAADDPVRWTFVAMTLDRTSNILTNYVMDGWVTSQWNDSSSPKTADTSAVGSLDSGYPTNIGQDGDGSGYDNTTYPELVASFDDMGVWRRALTTDEIWEIYTAGRAGQSLADVMPVLRGIAHTPTPDNNQDFVDKTIANLEWVGPGQGANKYDVYFGTDPNVLSPNVFFPKIMDYKEQTAVDPAPAGDLDPDTQYYWQVDTYEPNSPGPEIFHEGDLWSFRTSPDSPVILTQPVGIVIAVGETAEFVVGGINILTYTWFRSDDAANNTPADDVVVGAESPSPLLSIPDVGFGDEGYYYCVAANGPLSDVSDVASLVLKQLIHHYPLDGESAEDVVGGVNGTVVGDPVWITGIDGGAIDMFPSTMSALEDYIVLGEAGDIVYGTDDFTVSFWMKTPAGLGGDPAFISNKDWRSGNNVGWVIAWGGSTDGIYQWNLDTSGAGRSDYDPTGPETADDQWHLVTVAHDRQGMATFYIDGEVRGQVDISAHAANSLDAEWPTVIGNHGPQDYHVAYPNDRTRCAFDDVRIYNYPLDAVEVATLYTDFVEGASICLNRPVLDLVENCRVDLDDLVAVAEAWLECGRIPVEACNL